ncbi:MAG: hypothetical protein IJW19_05135 [Clostridia bacterium]|nr:hypothetical protein [Clostridia bacterium]
MFIMILYTFYVMSCYGVGCMCVMLGFPDWIATVTYIGSTIAFCVLAIYIDILRDERKFYKRKWEEEKWIKD